MRLHSPQAFIMYKLRITDYYNQSVKHDMG
jgi:hypothetical protein